MTLREQLIASLEMPAPVPVTVKGLEGKLFVKATTAADIDWAIEKEGEIRARVIAVTLCDEKGKCIFSRDDIETINNLGFRALRPISVAANKINGISGDDDEDDAKN